MIRFILLFGAGMLLGQLARWAYWEVRYRLTLRKALRILDDLERRLGPPGTK